VVVVGLATALIIGWLGVLQLQHESSDAADLRADVLATTLAERLRAATPAERSMLIERAASRSGAEVLLVDRSGRVLADGSVGGTPKDRVLRLLSGGAGETDGASGTSRFRVVPLSPPLHTLSVVVLVHLPDTSYRAGSLVTSVGAFAFLLVGIAAIAAFWLARDVHSDLRFVHERIVEMGTRDARPAGDPIPVRTADEVGVLTSAFNVLIDRFREAETAYRKNLAGVVASDRDRSVFLAALSHELRTPLNSILGFADVLLTEAEGPLTAEARENLEVVRSSGQHLRSLIDDILALSALESGQLRLERGEVNVFGIATDVVREAKVTAKSKQLTVQIAGQPTVAWADPLRVRQILGNVVGNAVKFTKQGSVFLHVDGDDDDVLITVTDSGPGIAPAQQALIFEEYRQVGDAASRRAGTGLGLAITRRLVQMHGGSIDLESELGVGSRFVIRLPRRPPPDEPGTGETNRASIPPEPGTT
jgi:signal transduction histidine kinase